MKTTLYILLLFVGFISQAQPCTELKIMDSITRSILLEYADQCRARNFFKEGIGVIEMTDFVDSTGHRGLHLNALIDDRYKNAPPKQYALVNGQLVFVYQGNSSGVRQQERNTPELITCLSNILGSRLYIRPAHKINETIDVIDSGGNAKKIRRQKSIYGGNQWNWVYYIFDTPTEYHIVRPL